MLTGLIWTFLYCYYATQTVDLLTNTANTIYNSNWYTYPIYIRKYFLLILARSQIPVYFTGFKIVRCSLETFKKVGAMKLFFLCTF